MLETRSEDNILICSLSGRLDADSSPVISETLLSHVQGDNRKVVIDLQGVSYISSMGLRIIVMAAKAVHAGGGALTLAAATPRVAKVLEIAALDSLLGHYSCMKDALATLR